MSTHDMADSPNVLILANRKVAIENISVGAAYKIVSDDLYYSKVSYCIPKMLMTVHKASYCSKNSENH